MSGPGDPRDGERRLDDLGRRLEDFERRAEASGTVRRKAEPAGAGSGLGTALKLSTELVAAVVVGGVMGWLLDAGSAPPLASCSRSSRSGSPPVS